jgi:hypothetical protein
VDIVHIVLEIDPEKGETDSDCMSEDIDLGNLEHQPQDSLANRKHSDTVDNPAAVDRVNIVDKHLLEVADMLVDQEKDEGEKDDDEENEEPRHGLEVRGYGFQLLHWNLTCW